ncbi:Leucine zipper protein [Dirofilaria immitis]
MVGTVSGIEIVNDIEAHSDIDIVRRHSKDRTVSDIVGTVSDIVGTVSDIVGTVSDILGTVSDMEIRSDMVTIFSDVETGSKECIGGRN